MEKMRTVFEVAKLQVFISKTGILSVVLTSTMVASQSPQRHSQGGVSIAIVQYCIVFLQQFCRAPQHYTSSPIVPLAFPQHPSVALALLQCHSITLALLQCHSIALALLQSHSITLVLPQCHSVAIVPQRYPSAIALTQQFYSAIVLM